MYKPIICLLALFAICSGPALGDSRSITLKPITLRSFGTVPPSALPEIAPAFKEKTFPLSEAINFAEVEAQIIGGLSEGQKRYLEEHRFVLVPKTAAIGAFNTVEWDAVDEMLSNFDSIGGLFDEWERRPENAPLLNPDVFLEALHKYFSQKLKYLERDELRAALKTVLTNLYANAKSLSGEGNAAPQWQRFMAQMLVPLILLENAADSPAYDDPDKSDTLASAHALLTPYGRDLSAELLKSVKTELERVYSASDMLHSTLGMFSTYHFSGDIDYTQFKPRGHYEENSKSRAWFRAMIWLGQVGWNLESEEGLTDALNFALAMSYDQAETSQRDEWQRVMEVTSFFAGYPDAPSYPQWQGFLAERGPAAGFNSQSSADADLVKALAADLKIPQPQTPFASFQSPTAAPVLTVFPQRFTVPWLIADRLQYTEPTLERQNVFSALWVPALMGSRFAQSLLPRQLFSYLSPRPNAALDASPLPYEEQLIPAASNIVLNAYLIKLTSSMAALSAELKLAKAEDWFSSFATAWFHILGTLTAEYGAGFPLYMRDPAFLAKELGTFLGSFAALKHDIILYEKPSYAEMGGEGGDPDSLNPPPVPKGFVEPNLPFWHELLRTVSAVEEGFRHYGLALGDIEEYGKLGRFKSDVAFCARMAEKELRGQGLTEEEYENIRTLKLQYMAEPPQGGGNIIQKKDTLSGLVVDVQTVTDGLIVYEALAEPYIMLALVGNDNSPRVVMGMAYNHREFSTPHGERVSDSVWNARVYGPFHNEYGDFRFENALPLPPKNFWYDSLRPARTAARPGPAKK